jgi:hypothetical protein
MKATQHERIESRKPSMPTYRAHTHLTLEGRHRQVRRRLRSNTRDAPPLEGALAGVLAEAHHVAKPPPQPIIGAPRARSAAATSFLGHPCARSVASCPPLAGTLGEELARRERREEGDVLIFGKRGAVGCLPLSIDSTQTSALGHGHCYRVAYPTRRVHDYMDGFLHPGGTEHHRRIRADGLLSEVVHYLLNLSSRHDFRDFYHF